MLCSTEYGRQIRTSKLSQIFRLIWADLLKMLWGICWIFSCIIITNFVTVHDFALISYFLIQKTKLFKHFKGAYIWVWVIYYLGCKEFGINTSCVRSLWFFYMMCSHNRFSLRFSSSFFFIVRYPHRTDDDLFHGSKTALVLTLGPAEEHLEKVRITLKIF